MDSSIIMISKHHVLLILFLFVKLYWLQGDALGNETDKIALLELKEAITSDPNGVFNSWNGSIHFCEWYGITCGRRHERVTSIKFKGQGLVGTISPYIGNLTFLRLIYLRNNSIGGRIPPEIGNLSRLQYLRLTNNSLGGEIPANLSRCSQLKWIELGGNNLTGSIPIELGNSLAKIEVIELVSNSLVGQIPPSFGNLSLLNFFSATTNYLVGGIPEELGQLTNLTYLYIGVNQLSGAIPRSLFNVTSFRHFFVVANRIEGSLPDNIGLTLPKLQYLMVGMNQMSGKIPSTLSNASELVFIGLDRNRFHGEVPTDLGRLGSLQQILLSSNNLGSKSTQDLAFLTSLLNCSSLEILDLSSNQFGGVLPSSIGNLSVEMSKLYLGGNYFTGNVPASLSNLVNLVLLSMEQNQFSGAIHPSFGKFQKLQVLSLGDNELSGQIPSTIGNNTQVLQLYLQQNKFEGSIPASIGNCGDLLLLDLSLNSLSGAIPGEVLSLSSLSQVLNLSHNSLQSLPAQVGKLMSISAIDISENNISGQIPETIGDCISLEYLYMQGNSFNGEIPSQMSSLRGLQYLDLSRNDLTGEIPEYMQNLSSLQFLNLSYNDLQGEVPKSGVFGNASRISLVGNGEVCGGIADLHLQKCSTKATKQNMSRTLKLAIIIICVLLFVFLLIGMSAIFWLKRSKQVPASKSRTDVVDHHLRISYRDLYQATDGFSSRNLVGSGSFGSIYKGYLDQIKKSVAVKVLNLQQKGAAKSFMAETDALRNIRHRNLVKVITSCVSLDSQGNEFMALVYEFMENLSLEKWLYPEIDSEMGSKHLGLLQRLNIAIDVASALHYLHNLNEDTIVHRDLKPSNILLDGDMVAHVGDFGLARLLSNADGADQSETTTAGIKGTIGYAAPEYGMGWRASVEGDVYSYGIIVLEMFTGKRPTDEIFAYGSSLRDHVKAAIPERLMHVLDPSLLPNAAPERNDTSRATTEELDSRNKIEVEVGSYYTKENPTDIKTNEQDCLISLLELGVACSTESSKERMKMVDVVRELHKIKRSFLRV